MEIFVRLAVPEFEAMLAHCILRATQATDAYFAPTAARAAAASVYMPALLKRVQRLNVGILG